MGEFQGKVVVITGGSRGIGKAIGAAFAREGAQVVLAAVSADNLAAAAKSMTGGPPPLTVAGDLSKLEACQALFAAVKSKFNRCDVLVNNVGATKAGKFSELTDGDFLDGFALKYFAAVRLCRLFWPMLRDAHGNVINIIGGAARTPGAEFLIGGSVNSAFSNFSKGLAALGNREDVNVNVIHPGTTETDRVVTLFEAHAKAQGKTPEQVRAESTTKTGIRRIGQPEDSAELAVFLASAKARHIQGTAIAVDGGSTSGLF